MTARPPAPSETAGWLRPAEPSPDAEATVFLFHYSGGGVSMYSRWPALLPPSVDCRRVQLPGRQDRVSEPPFTELDPLVEALCEVLAKEQDGRPYALFGHSMGAMLAYRVAVAMARRGYERPALLGVSGWAPQGFRTISRKAAHETDEAVVQLLRELGSVPAEAFDGNRLSPLMLAPMRADLAVCADFRDDGASVDCPLVAYTGREDPYLAPGAMQSWRARSADFLGIREFPGGHFFIHDQGPGIATDLAQTLIRLRAS
ncbi:MULTISPECIES: alpha/beta fold hydrolase [Streptomycetaceae]|uniref:thioesterase II family protein n=1 Tax=unclassified Streptomyces TaxID=2593676 RepID=UPI00337EB07A